MYMYRLKYYTKVVANSLLLMVSSQAYAQGGEMFMRNLSTSIVKVREDASPVVRTEAAKHLFELTKGVDPKLVNDETIVNIANLLDNADDSVRYWIARCLGNFGPRAKFVAPKLVNLLAEVDRLQGSKTSASGIRFALTQMGIVAPPPHGGAAAKQ